MPRVSVIVPNYNHARFLDQRLKSVLDQTYRDFELVILDDASTDGSRDVIAKYAEQPGVRTVFNDRNSGSAFRQWNKGVALAQGEYIWIAESDDYAGPRLLERLVAAIGRRPEIGLAYGQSLMVDEEGRPLISGLGLLAGVDARRWERDFEGNGLEECRQFLLNLNTIPSASAVLFRRSVYEACGGANERMTYAGDWLMWAKMLCRSDVAFVAETLNYSRWHPQTVRKQSSLDGRQVEERLIVLRFLRDHAAVPREAVRRRCREILAEWAELATEADREIPLKRQAGILGRAAALSPSSAAAGWVRYARLCAWAWRQRRRGARANAA